MNTKTTLLPILFLALAGIIPTNAQSRGGGETDAGYGNNLSYPVVFAEGYGITGLEIPSSTAWSEPYAEPFPTAGDETGMRPVAGEVFSTFPWLVVPFAADSAYYAQNTENTWRAQWKVGSSGVPEQVQVDWGDNLISQRWTVTQPVRVETVLRQTTSMAGFPMVSLVGTRRSEIQATTGVAEPSLGRTVYSRTAHLTIQKYNSTWTTVIANGCSVDKTVYSASGDGPGNYAAEVNVSGALIYGYNWMLSQCKAAPDNTKEGNWRITFSLDETAGPVVRNVEIVQSADISSPITKVSWGPYSSSLDIGIVSTRPTGGGGKGRNN